VRYAVAKHVCDRPSPGEVSCDAIKLVPSSKTTHGAKAYVSPSYQTGPAGGFTPADLASAYGYNPAAAVSQTVAIVDAYDDPNARADLNAFDAHYGLPQETSTSFRKVNENGSTSPLPTADAGWAGEISLDIEAVRAVCNQCKILLVEGKQPSDSDLATAVNTAVRLGATEVSNSYGAPENPNADPSIAAAYNHPGVVISASTGDHGWYDWDFANDGSSGASDNAPNTPAAYPTVVAVAGTALALNSDGTRQEEDVWNENGPDDENGLYLGNWWGDQGASGGGCSWLYSAPAWQAGVSGYANTGCGSKRATGDVAALADPYTGFDIYDSYQSSGWQTTGGTSLASPLVAAMWALAGGSGGVKYPAESLYDNLHFRPTAAYDVTLGGNSFCAGDSTANCSAALEAQTDPPTGNPNNINNGNSFYANGWAGLLDCGYNYDGSEGTIAANTQCNAVSGYDGASGVGAPHGLNLFRFTHPTIGIARPSVLELNTAQTWSAVNFADPVGGTATGYTWNWGDGTTSSTSDNSTTHTFGAAGTHKVTVTVTDSYGQTGAASMSITVGVPPTAVISGSTTVHVGSKITWSSSKSTDKNTGGKIVGHVWKLGTTKVGTAATWTHTFKKTGRHTLTLTVTDNTGLKGSKKITITVVR
jgi:plastocyanin